MGGDFANFFGGALVQSGDFSCNEGDVSGFIALPAVRVRCEEGSIRFQQDFLQGQASCNGTPLCAVVIGHWSAKTESKIQFS